MKNKRRKNEKIIKKRKISEENKLMTYLKRNLSKYLQPIAEDEPGPDPSPHTSPGETIIMTMTIIDVIDDDDNQN